MQPKVIVSPDPLNEALRKIHEQVYQVVPADYIDLALSTIAAIIPPIAPAWAKVDKLFNGDITKQATQLGVGASFTLVFVKPIYLNWSYLRADVAGGHTMSVVYSNGVVELLAQNVIGGYDAFAPPTQALPVHSITITNVSGALRTLYQLIMSMVNPVNIAFPGGGIPVTIVGSTNQFYVDDTITPIPAGLVGVNVVFGFNSIAIIFSNDSANVLQVSEDGGLTWERVRRGFTISFDAKQRGSIMVRDPAGVGGQAYSLWVW